ncbi:hypothetical protein K435DRAFT_846816 [Dendrothele bispora CBS 962.96]|uniref:DUF6534 domain-containing protein n=1 Tax=Dendrothele bispora (strain CBS 962.96) TaxID=1314807 RepID=A0A4S8KKU7_DENBC|nr:hypothetical protein K435DRAFT_846816 [Dendrothele bispora CBS 962.96]
MAEPPKPPTVTEVYAPIFVGAFLSTALYGLFVAQSFTYLQTSRGDKKWMKLLILYLFIAETANTIFDIGMVYEPLLLKFGDLNVVANSPLFLRADGVVTALISTPSQMFMAWRIRVVMQSWIPFFLVMGFALASLSASIWLAVEVTNSPQFQSFDDFRGAPTTWLVTSAAADILIAVCLVWGLSRKRTEVSQLNDQIDRIIRFAIQTGAITAIAALADAIVFVSVPHTTIFFSWDLCLSKLYSNTLLSSINARNSWRLRNSQQSRMPPNALYDSSELSSDPGNAWRLSRGVNSIPLSKIPVSPKNTTFQLQSMQGQPWKSPPPSRSRMQSPERDIESLGTTSSKHGDNSRHHPYAGDQDPIEPYP